MKHLSLKNVTFGYQRGRPLFNNLGISFSNPHLDNGYIIALMGASGSGKSTIVNLALKTLTPQGGSVDSNPANPRISFVPQEPILFNHLSSEENAKYFNRTDFYRKSFDETLYKALVKDLDMERVFAQTPNVNDLSGGQKQRVMLIRALSVRPDFLLLDEPTTGLDAEVKNQFLNQLRQIVLSQRILTVYVTHHRSEAEFIADEIAFLTTSTDGAKVYQRAVKDFLEYPPTIEANKMFHYPTPNVLCCLLNSNGTVSITRTEDATHCLAVPPSAVRICDKGGVPFEIVSSNPVYSTVEVYNQKLTLRTSDVLLPGKELVLEGQLLLYSKEGVFQEMIKL